MAAFEVAFLDEAGAKHRLPLSSGWNIAFERMAPARTFPSFKGQVNFPGLWWSATTNDHVGYESWLERDVVMMMDFDPGIVGFASQPFWLSWIKDGRLRRHAPDYFARTSEGDGLVVDVRPDDRIDARSARAFAVMERACAAVGWRFHRTGGPPAVAAANVRWLAGYRHPRCFRADVAEALTAVFAESGPLLAGAKRVGDRLSVLPVLFHLLWSGQLSADLSSAPLSLASIVSVSGRQLVGAR
ncbi:TnsA-like heteromeric transposase endonuclease subunit [Nonomuraea sp. NPDC046570]|uniref:TnsA-like heteromeric transposase endonuclease subunit n=1 Tax=Nonomuraea sp. NPDC046570 TaxID=3155255 RepID=UPI0033EC8C8B